jgi:hypothetical protein
MTFSSPRNIIKHAFTQKITAAYESPELEAGHATGCSKPFAGGWKEDTIYS